MPGSIDKVIVKSDRYAAMVKAIERGDDLLRVLVGVMEDMTPEELSEPPWVDIFDCIEDKLSDQEPVCPHCGKDAIPSFLDRPGCGVFRTCQAGHEFEQK